MFQFGVQLQNGNLIISSSCFSVELHCKIRSQLLPLFETMEGRSLQYFIILSRFMSNFLRKKFTVIFTYRRMLLSAYGTVVKKYYDSYYSMYWLRAVLELLFRSLLEVQLHFNHCLVFQTKIQLQLHFFL